ncbi:septum formation family protein [Nocardiopsis sp. CNR-923]|uniref:septum formation family protein n=1 Tax=Nocardiopsis sp. CNR-923 TaxID=1904965 RepID=UPI0009638812|nr:septum formation family protein [Nocardiopsis sp. CNR-923]OLT24665.1 septum formation family protein [Nocardiopsis sp. CNR-923]
MPSVSPVARAALVSATAVGAVLSLSGCDALITMFGGGNAFEVAVGDCFVEEEMLVSGADSEVSDVPLVDCAEPHDSEIYYVFDMEGDTFPGQEAVWAEADETCQGQAFTDFVGLAFTESEIFTGSLAPSEESWDRMNDREVVCYVFTEESTTGSLQGANR